MSFPGLTRLSRGGLFARHVIVQGIRLAQVVARSRGRILWMMVRQADSGLFDDFDGLCAQNCINGTDYFSERYGATSLTFSRGLNHFQEMNR